MQPSVISNQQQLPSLANTHTKLSLNCCVHFLRLTLAHTTHQAKANVIICAVWQRSPLRIGIWEILLLLIGKNACGKKATEYGKYPAGLINSWWCFNLKLHSRRLAIGINKLLLFGLRPRAQPKAAGQQSLGVADGLEMVVTRAWPGLCCAYLRLVFF